MSELRRRRSVLYMPSSNAKALEKGVLPAAELDEVLDPRQMTEGGVLGVAVGG